MFLLAPALLYIFALSLRSCEGWCVHGEVKPLSEVSASRADDTCNTCECYLDAWDCTYHTCATGEKFDEIGTVGDSLYKLGNSKLHWGSAKSDCEKENGHLAVMNSPEEWTELFALLKAKGKNDDFWLGAKAKTSGYAGPWAWIDGTTLSVKDPRWDNWGQPNDNGAACLFTAAWRSNPNNWSDGACRFTQQYICEFPIEDSVSR